MFCPSTLSVVLLLAVACAAPQAPCPDAAFPKPEEESIGLRNEPLVVESGEELPAADQAYNLGDPVRAARILDLIATTDERHADAEALRKKVKADVDALANSWYEEMSTLMAKGQYRLARARGLYILEHFPVSEEMRGAVEVRLEEVKKGVAAARVEISDLDRQADDQLLRHDFVGALKTLRRAEKVAKRFNFRDALDIESRMAAAEFRFAHEKVPESIADASRKTAKTSRKRRTMEKGKTTPSPSPSPVSPSSVENGREVANAKEVQERLREAARYQKKKAYFEAIVRFEQVRDLDPQNETAKVALQGLDARRKTLIRDFLATANEFFLKQDLAGAVPYFKKVRKLDPTNEEALEGLEMFENLERIRSQRQ